MRVLLKAQYRFTFYYALFLFFLIFSFFAPSFGENSESVKSISVNDIALEIPQLPEQKPHAGGTIVSTDLKLQTRADHKNSSFHVILVPNEMKIISAIPQGDDLSSTIRITRQENTVSLYISHLSQNEPLIIRLRLEVGTSESISSPSQGLMSHLEIKLQQKLKRKKVSSKSLRLEWPLVNCAKAFHTAINRLAQEKLPSIHQALQNAQVRDKTIPSDWIFHPKEAYHTVIEEKEICIRKKTRGRKHKAECLEYKTVKTEKRQRLQVSKQTQAVYETASTYVKNQATAPLLKKEGAHYWVASQIAEDLEIYLRQDAHPALCTGTEAQIEFYRGKLGGLRKTVQTLQNQLEVARTQTREQLTGLKIALRNQEEQRLKVAHHAFMQKAEQQNNPATHNYEAGALLQDSLPRRIIYHMTPRPVSKLQDQALATGSAVYMCLKKDDITMFLETQDRKTSLQDLMIEIAATIGDVSFVRDLSNTNDFHSALIILYEKKKFLSEEKKLSEDSLAKMHITLATLEAAHHLQTVKTHYDQVLSALNDNLDSILNEQKKNCSCGI